MPRARWRSTRFCPTHCTAVCAASAHNTKPGLTHLPTQMCPHPQVGADATTSKVLLIVNSLETSPERKDTIIRAGRNVENLYINTADKIRVFDVLKAHKLVVEEGALAHINKFYGPQEKAERTAPAAAAAEA